MTTERLQEFAILANTLNYSKAAEKLFVSQPILSRHIKDLERELGTPLFVRDTHGVRLTDGGKFLLRWVEPLLEKTERAVASLHDDRVLTEGLVHIGCEEQTLNRHILSFIHTFQDNYPDIALSLSPYTTSTHKEQLYSADITLTLNDFTESPRKDISGAFLTTQDALLAIPPRHSFGDLQGISLDQLEDQRLIVPYMDEMLGPYVRNANVAARRCHGTVRKIGAENAYAALLMVELGAGLMVIPHHLKHRIYPNTRTIPITDADCVFPIYCYINRANQNPAAELFYEKIVGAFVGYANS